jgi:hypothetical protein
MPGRSIFWQKCDKKTKLARFMHSTHGSHERNPLPQDLGIAIYGASNGFGSRARNEKEMKMTASLSRFAYSSPVQAGERQTVHHVIGARRPLNGDSLKMLGTGHKVTHHKGVPSYGF